VDLKSLVGLLRKPAAPTDALRQHLDALPTAIETAERRAEELEQQRRSTLLDGDDEALAKIETDIASANRQVERLFIAHGELKQRLAEAEERERHDTLTAERETAEKEAASVVADIGKKYPKLAGEIASLLQRLDAAEAVVEAVNGKLAASGRAAERLDAVEVRLFPKKASQAPHLHFWSLRHEIRLPEVPGWSVGWGESAAGFPAVMDREAA
jgi:chromosome segregation ATPase